MFLPQGIERGVHSEDISQKLPVVLQDLREKFALFWCRAMLRNIVVVSGEGVKGVEDIACRTASNSGLSTCLVMYTVSMK